MIPFRWCFQIDKPAVIEKRPGLPGVTGGGNEEVTPRSVLGAMKLFCTLTVVLVTFIYTCVKKFSNCTPKVNFLCHDLRIK